ncbi:putative NTP pyrophosphohydrolase MazG-like protein [Rhizobium phage RHph_N65]|nr:putative NTP pyrophosphohydrolase MazG-like protein [Rhizobium phage RHph_N65]
MKPAINKLTHDDVRKLSENIGYMESVDADGDALSFYQRLATKSAIYPGQGTPLGLAYVALKLNGEAGELAEHVGKAMRDDNMVIDRNDYCEGYSSFSLDNTLAADRRELIIKEIGDALWYLSAACNELGITLADAAIANLRKLADRTERDALRGSGDER